MSLGKDIVDIYTKSSVYYLRLQYLVVCYLMVLAAAFFILPLPREMGINGSARLMVGGALYIGFAVLLVYAPKLLYPLIGKLLSPYKDEKEVEEKFNRLSEEEKQEVEKAIEAHYGVSLKKKGVLVITMSKMQRVATNVFFQCLLIELFCLAILINQDHSLMISNPVTQNIADVLSKHVGSKSPNDLFFALHDHSKEGSSTMIPFDQFYYMRESVFFIYMVFFVLYIVRLVAAFIASRPILETESVLPIIKNAQTIGKMIWALLTTLVISFVMFLIIHNLLTELYKYISQILSIDNWIRSSISITTVSIINVLIFFRFMEDWYKKIFRKF
ncbi:MAG: hypothetical protein IJV35_09660 [Neisseriaceae bacterium]|nr:hypothetical protein [Neisseriaceae bacterium]